MISNIIEVAVKIGKTTTYNDYSDLFDELNRLLTIFVKSNNQVTEKEVIKLLTELEMSECSLSFLNAGGPDMVRDIDPHRGEVLDLLRKNNSIK